MSWAAWLLSFAAVSLALASPTLAGELRDGAVKPTDGFARIEALSGDRVIGTGNAVVITPDHLVTACHVVADADRLVLSRDDLKQPTTLTAMVPGADLCVLTRSSLPAQPLRQRQAPLAADAQLALIGSRAGGHNHQLSTGTVIAWVSVGGVPLMLTDAPVPPGLSGAGAIDSEGQLVGFAVGRWLMPAFGVVVEASALKRAQVADPADTHTLSSLPVFLDERQVWPDMLLIGLRQMDSGAATASRSTGEWHITRQGSRCQAVTRDPRQNDFGLTLDLVGMEGGVAVSLSVERHDVRLAAASRPLTVTLYPSRHSFSLRPSRLVQARDKAAAGLWAARWDLDDAEGLLRALPKTDAMVVSVGKRDLGGLALDPQALWAGLRDTCL